MSGNEGEMSALLQNDQTELDKFCSRIFLSGAPKPPIAQFRQYMLDREFLLHRALTRSSVKYVFDSNLSQIFHHFLDQDEKKVVFESAYHIGSPEKNEGLTGFWGFIKDQGLGVDYELATRIKHFISDFTGVGFDTYVDRDESLAYKVLGLFYMKCKAFPQFLSFLRGGPEDKINLEFRFSHPVNESANQNHHEKSAFNTAHYSELLSSLTFQMPPQYLAVSRSLYITIPMFTERLVRVIHNWVQVCEDSAAEPLKYLLEDVFQPFKNNLHDRLDFKLHTALVLKEYEVRMRSNAIIQNIIRDMPLDLNPLGKNCCSDLSEDEFIGLITGGNQVKAKDLDREVEFLGQIVCKYRPGTKFNKSQMAIAKALLAHDFKLKIELPCTMQGSTNIPDSVNSIFKNLKGKEQNLIEVIIRKTWPKLKFDRNQLAVMKVLKKHNFQLIPELLQINRDVYIVPRKANSLFRAMVSGMRKNNILRYYETNGFEPIIYFWDIRYRYAKTILSSQDKDQAKREYFNMEACERLMDLNLIDFVRNANLERLQLLPQLQRELGEVLSSFVVQARLHSLNNLDS